jgi:putative glutamine amidotransferase
MSNAQPLVGIVCYGRGKDSQRYSLPLLYVECARRARCRVVILPPSDPPELGTLDILDGLILAGGGDMDPKHYGQEPHPTLYGIDPERDVMELALTREALKRRTPTLAICRGLQTLNVALGGDLIQHLPDAVGDKVAHRPGVPGGVSHHPVRAAAGSRLAELCGASFSVASSHHQAVGRLGEGLVATAWAEDGIVEALELPENPDLMAVQWHPEETAAQDPIQDRLFAWLTARIRDRVLR